MSAENQPLPPFEEFVDHFIAYATPTRIFSLDYWQGVAKTAHEVLRHIQGSNGLEPQSVGGRGFLLTSYDALRIYGTVEPEFHSHTPHVTHQEDKTADTFPAPKLFDDNGCYNV